MSNESNRAEFDAWFAGAWAKYEDKEVTSEIKSKVWALKAWRHFVRAASANETVAEAVAIPAGYALVPIEPTPQMRKAAADAWLDCGSKLLLNKAAAAAQAAIAAAPSSKEGS